MTYIQEGKVCVKCGEFRLYSEYNKSRRSKDGYRSECNACRRLYRLENKDTISKRKKIYRDAHKDIISKKKKLYYDKNKEEIAIKGAERYLANKDLIKNRRHVYYVKNKERIKNRVREYAVKNKGLISERNKLYRDSKAKYATYRGKLTVDEKAALHPDGESLSVVCRYCGRRFVPTNGAVKKRISALVEDNGYELFLYCSNNCKKACPVYRQILYPKGYKKATSREVQPQLRQLVLERDNWSCQKCSKTVEEVQLHCHHILPLNESPVESADIDNCITLCDRCHKEVHKLPDCAYYELKCNVNK